MSKEKKIDYYQREEVSNSDLKIFKQDPMMYKYLKENPDRKEEKDELEFGNVLHTKIFEKDQFDQRYVVSDQAIPGKLGDFVRIYCETKDPERAFSEADIINMKFETAKKKLQLDYVVNYMNLLNKSTGRKIISSEMDQTAEEMIRVLKNNEAINSYLFRDEFYRSEGYDIYNEFEIYWSVPGIDLKLRSKLDKVYINKDTDYAIWFDYKSSIKPSKDRFIKTAIYEYEYHQAAAYYSDALKDLYWNSYHRELTVEHALIAQYKKAPYQVWPLRFSHFWIEQGREQYLKLLKELYYRKKYDVWHDLDTYGDRSITMIDESISNTRFKYNFDDDDDEERSMILSFGRI